MPFTVRYEYSSFFLSFLTNSAHALYYTFQKRRSLLRVRIIIFFLYQIQFGHLQLFEPALKDTETWRVKTILYVSASKLAKLLLKALKHSNINFKVLKGLSHENYISIESSFQELLSPIKKINFY